MRRAVASLLVVVLLIALAAAPAQAGGTATKVALGLASFAVFNQLFGGVFHPRPVYAYPRPVYAYSPVYVAPPPVVYAPPAYPPTYVVSTPQPTVVHYPHGRYELRADGAQYTWVWIPSPPAPPPPPSYQPAPSQSEAPAGAPCKPTGRYVKTPQGTLPECE